MPKKSAINPFELSSGEQTSIRLLLAAREHATAVAQASVNAANSSVRNYLIQILNTRSLDPAKWGISPDMSTIVEIQQPAADPNAPPATPADASVPGGPQTFAQTAPPPAPPAVQPAAPAAAPASA